MQKKGSKHKKRVKKSPSRPRHSLAAIKNNVKVLRREALAPALRFFSAKARGVFVASLIGALLIWMFSAFSFFNNTSQFQNATVHPAKTSPQIDLSFFTKKNDPITLIATGDILLARFIEKKMRSLNDYTYPFQKVADFLKSADITFGNLETPLLPGKNVPKESMWFRGDPEGVQGLLFAGYDVLSIANNHMMNYQVPGLTRTLQELKKAKIHASGGGKNQDAAHTPAIAEVKGKKIAFYSYADPNIPPGEHGYAKFNFPGIARMDIESVKNDVKNALEFADIVVVSMHAGNEYTRKPTQFQRDFAHGAIDAGAALVIGHHPHWVQPVERYKNGVIFYSLGNFVFDQFFSQETQTGLIGKVIFQKGELIVDLVPIKLDKGQPRILEGGEREEILKQLGL